MKFNRPPGEDRYMTGLWNADSKGFAAAQDPKFTERDNPYKQFEHRQFWLDGFRRARAEAPSPETNVRNSVSREEAIEFLNVAARNWDHIDPLSEDDIGDVATALLWFANKWPAATEGSVEDYSKIACGYNSPPHLIAEDTAPQSREAAK